MESNVDAAEWKLEVERVLPLLKVHIRTDNKVSKDQCCTDLKCQSCVIPVTIKDSLNADFALMYVQHCCY